MLIWKFVFSKDPQMTKAILYKKEEGRKHHITWIKNILQSYNNWIAMILAWEQTHKLMENNTQPRNKSAFTDNLIFSKCIKKTVGEIKLLQ
jgi:hypothetical protein